MSLLFKPHRHEPTEPQLAAMIDVFSILIIFLIAGTVMGNSAVLLPAGMLPPKSRSKETMMAAPQITVQADRVETSFTTASYALKDFMSAERSGPEIQRFKKDIAALVEASKGKENAGIINLLADRATSYDRIFAVIKVAREAGAQSILFVAVNEAGP